MTGPQFRVYSGFCLLTREFLKREQNSRCAVHNGLKPELRTAILSVLASWRYRLRTIHHEGTKNYKLFSGSETYLAFARISGHEKRTAHEHEISSRHQD